MTTQADEAVIDCRNLWKIFGRRADEAMKAVQEQGLGKLEVRDRFDCVVGVQDATFSVGRGEIFCIMGLSGSGKSTLIRHVNRLIEPTSGQLFIEGQDVNQLSARELREVRAEKIGMVFQNMALMPHRTVLENVSFSQEVRGHDARERRENAMRAIDAVDLNGWDQKYPDELSGGMQQRVGLARAIAADPSILLMDEPFSALDPLIRRQLQDKFMSLSAEMKKTTLFITHDLDEAIRIGDRIAIMKDGALVQVGTPEDIVTSPADDYVADFVAGISKLELISAGKIMEPVASFEQRQGPIDLGSWPEAHPDHSLDDLVNLSIATQHPVVVKADGRAIGIVTKNALLRGIQGHADDAGSLKH
ncbi:glycine betaine/L-proline ABC transporter ATP-binding protein [Leisingera aquaemixtae]|uniref:quaternary amine ABC transporter ATP-binding protein n=1 Tax=Leisingera TaxID=191028 RepID=UPI001C95A93D|nr:MULTISPECIES: glycine betaine/L-proline ABC transporter ATP-binding protein [Leisingera]MBY6069173.1 glycine betaine/L-proline ABC transporter ATP-binding protein [Leisingera aquaemixtae]MCB4457030.1 glycine betaine/L-proline ABC transporter ATP-binding protein [Leisingera sp. McT4-56]